MIQFFKMSIILLIDYFNEYIQVCPYLSLSDHISYFLAPLKFRSPYEKDHNFHLTLGVLCNLVFLFADEN